MRVAVGIILGIITVAGAEIAGFELADLRSKNPNAECEYHSIASFMPGRIIVCELFRKRW